MWVPEIKLRPFNLMEGPLLCQPSHRLCPRPTVLRQGLLLSCCSSIQLGWLVSELQEPARLSPQTLVTDAHAFHLGTDNPISGLHVCVAAIHPSSLNHTSKLHSGLHLWLLDSELSSTPKATEHPIWPEQGRWFAHGRSHREGADTTNRHLTGIISVALDLFS